MTKKNEEHVVHSLIYVCNLCKKKGQRRRSIIPKSMCELDFSFFSFSKGVLINIPTFFQKKSNDVLKNSYFDLSP